MPFNHFKHPPNQMYPANDQNRKISARSITDQRKGLQTKKEMLLSSYDEMQSKSRSRSKKRNAGTGSSTSRGHAVQINNEAVVENNDPKAAIRT